MSPRNLLRRFKAATGHLPGEYLQLLRVAAARELLERGRAPVQKVAAAVGYDDVPFFRGIFKRHTGMTPAEYRSRFGPLVVDRGALASEPESCAVANITTTTIAGRTPRSAISRIRRVPGVIIG